MNLPKYGMVLQLPVKSMGRKATPQKNQHDIYESDLLPIRKSETHFVSPILPSSPFMRLDPPIGVDLKTKLVYSKFLTNRPYMKCAKLLPFMVLNEYKARCLLHMCEMLNVPGFPGDIMDKMYDSQVDPKATFLLSLRRPITLLDFNLFIDIFECSAILYNNHEFVAYYVPNESNAWLVMKIHSPYDLTYMGIAHDININDLKRNYALVKLALSS